MNDHDAIDAINAVLDQYFRGELNQTALVGKICRISGQNTIDHMEAKDVK
jgi:hypothetical protein